MSVLLLISCIVACSTPNNQPHPSNTANDISPRIVIIGGGASGMSTAIRLIELGLEPIILERESMLGGGGIHAGRFFATESVQQFESDQPDSAALVLEEWSEITGSQPDETITRFVQESANTLAWIESYDVQFNAPVLDAGAGSSPRIHPLSPNTQHPLKIWMEILSPYTHLNTTVTAIEQRDDSFLLYSTTDTFSATHIVIASGGFARNAEIVLQSIPDIIQFDWHTEAWPGMTGDAHHWFNTLSISTQNMNHLGLYAHSISDPLLGYPETMIVPALERSMIVTESGHRIFDETKTQSLYSGVQMLEHGPLFAIYDADSWSGTFFQGMGYNYDPPQVMTAEDMNHTDIPIHASDILELSNILNIPFQTLSETIETYNYGFENNTDLFGKDLSSLRPIQRPPFTAIPLVLSTGKSFGGAKIDYDGQTNIANVYAVGEAAGFLGSNSVGWGFSGSITACYYQGKKTAEHIYAAVSE